MFLLSRVVCVVILTLASHGISGGWFGYCTCVFEMFSLSLLTDIFIDHTESQAASDHVYHSSTVTLARSNPTVFHQCLMLAMTPWIQMFESTFVSTTRKMCSSALIPKTAIESSRVSRIAPHLWPPAIQSCDSSQSVLPLQLITPTNPFPS
jgi:hypothetical protein